MGFMVAMYPQAGTKANLFKWPLRQINQAAGRPGYHVRMESLRLLCLLLGFATAPALAQTTDGPPAEVGFDCWIGTEGPPFHLTYIRCISDRELPHPELADARLNDFLDRLHREFHDKSGKAAEQMYKANIELVRESRSVWNIRIYSYPYELSWAEGRPQQLVRAVLCPKDIPCTVVLLPR
jgi:hypothetical protein